MASRLTDAATMHQCINHCTNAGLILAPMLAAPKEARGYQFVPSMALGVLILSPTVAALLTCAPRRAFSFSQACLARGGGAQGRRCLQPACVQTPSAGPAWLLAHVARGVLPTAAPCAGHQLAGRGARHGGWAGVEPGQHCLHHGCY